MNQGSTVILLLGLGLLALMRWAVPIYLKRQIERGIDAKFDRELESFRSALRMDEQRITSLQNAVLSGSTARSGLHAARRMQAVEAIWEEVCRLGKFRWIVGVMQILKVDNVAERARTDVKVRQWVEVMMGGLDLKDLAGGKALLHRPFVSDQTWAAFSVYSSLVHYSVALLSLVKTGIENPRGVMDAAKLAETVRAALPHQADYIERVGETAVFYLVDELFDALLLAIRAEIDGREAEQQSVEQARRVIKLAEEVQSKPQGLPPTT